jgi:serine/threonine protein kinase
MPSPSDKLVTRLTELQLCTRADILACESIVRELCDDLPDFDSVWLDALVQTRILTPWQVATLQSPRADFIRQEEYLLLDQLGQHTWLARDTSQSRLVVLHEIPTDSAEHQERQLTAVDRLLESLESVHHPSVALPHDVVRNSKGTSLFLVSDYISGWNLDELLVRGGRLPSSAVAEIGRDLLNALAWFESQHLVHGNISLRNVRITASGQPMLVAPFISRLRSPAITYRTNLTLQSVEFAAPELAGTGRLADHRSDMYSMGCVLWQALTSRPVFLTADPLRRIASAKNNDVEDVRVRVPDCPDWMARLIQSMTRRSPELRPTSVAEVSRVWKQNCHRSHGHTKTLVKRLPDRGVYRAKAVSAPKYRSKRISTLTTAILLIAGIAVVMGLQSGLIPSTLRVGNTADNIVPDNVLNASQALQQQHATTPATTSPDITAATTSQSSRDTPLPLPTPDASGIISLAPDAWYAATEVTFAGHLRIECPNSHSANLIIPRSSQWQLAAADITLRNLNIYRSHPTSNPTQPGSASNTDRLLDLHCDNLTVDHCVIRNSNIKNTQSCIVWNPVSPQAQNIHISNSILTGCGWGLYLKNRPQDCSLQNVLLTETGAALRCDIAASDTQERTFTVSRVTQFGGHGLMDVLIGPNVSTDVPIRLTTNSSVLATDTALVRIATLGDDSQSQLAQVRFLLPEHGNLTIVPDHVRPAIYVDRKLKSVVDLSPNQLVVEGILLADPIFKDTAALPSTASPLQACVLDDYEGPKRGSSLPGIDISLLPTSDFTTSDDPTALQQRTVSQGN